MPTVRTNWIGAIAGALLLAGAAGGCAVLERPSSGDARITAQVKARLGQYPELQEPNMLDVQTVHGVVYLHGLMNTPFEVRLASSVAGQVPGVRRVENLIGLDDGR